MSTVDICIWAGIAVVLCGLTAYWLWGKDGLLTGRFWHRVVRAGQYVIYYPPGTTMVAGVETANKDVATRMLLSLCDDVLERTGMLNLLPPCRGDNCEACGPKAESKKG